MITMSILKSVVLSCLTEDGRYTCTVGFDGDTTKRQGWSAYNYLWPWKEINQSFGAKGRLFLERG